MTDRSQSHDRVAALAAQQGGHVARWQLRFLGLPDGYGTRAVATLGWTAVHHGVYRMAGVPWSPIGEVWAALLAVSTRSGFARAESWAAQDHDRVEAALLAVVRVAAATGATAAWLHGLRKLPPREPQLVVDASLQVRRDGVRVVRSTCGQPAVDTVRGVPTASPYRILWDVAWTWRSSPNVEEILQDLAVGFDRLRLFTVDELLLLVEEPVALGLPARPPSALRRAAEALRPGFSHSKTEAIGREIAIAVAQRHGFTATPRPYKVRGEGPIIAEADVAVIDLRWDAEIDGPHHDVPSVRRQDRRRDGRMAAIDWAVDRYSHRLIDHDLAEYERRFTTDLLGRAAAVESGRVA